MEITNLQKLNLSITGTDAAGTVLPLPAGSTVAYNSDNPAIFAATLNPDGVTAVGAAVAVGSCNVSAVLTLPGGATLSSPPTVVTVTQAPIVAISLNEVVA